MLEWSDASVKVHESLRSFINIMHMGKEVSFCIFVFFWYRYAKLGFDDVGEKALELGFGEF